MTARWERYEDVEHADVIKELPLPLQLELAICIHKDIILKVRGLRRCHVHVQRHIARRLHAQLNYAGDYVYRDGEIGSEIYFLLKGEVEVTAKVGENHVRHTLKDGSHFGGQTLYSVSGERHESVRCVTNCELYFIHKDELEQLAVEFPEHQEIGIFADLFQRDKKTVRQSRELQRQVAEISGNVKNSPLARFTARHIDKVLGTVDTTFLEDKVKAESTAAGDLEGAKAAKPQLQRSTSRAVLSVAELSGGTSRVVAEISPRVEPSSPSALPLLASQPSIRANLPLETKNVLKAASPPPVRTGPMSPLERANMARQTMKRRTSTFRNLRGRNSILVVSPKSAVASVADRADSFKSLPDRSNSAKALLSYMTGEDEDGDSEAASSDIKAPREKQRTFRRTAKDVPRTMMRGSITFEDAQEYLKTLGGTRAHTRDSFVMEMSTLNKRAHDRRDSEI